MKRAYGKWFTRRHAVKIAGIGLIRRVRGSEELAVERFLSPPILGRPSRDSPTLGRA
jgi:hypothetical protein